MKNKSKERNSTWNLQLAWALLLILAMIPTVMLISDEEGITGAVIGILPEKIILNETVNETIDETVEFIENISQNITEEKNITFELNESSGENISLVNRSGKEKNEKLENVTIQYGVLARTLLSVSITSPANNTLVSAGSTFTYTCTADYSGGSASGTTGDGNWSYCSGLGCTPLTDLVTTSTTDLTGNDTDGKFACTSCGDSSYSQVVTMNGPGTYRLKCFMQDQDGVKVNSAEVTVNGSLSCGATLTTSVTLTEDINTSGNCLTIGSDNVVVDCAGYEILYGEGGTGIGINNTGYDNVTVKNCKITKNGTGGGNNFGIQYSGALEGTISNNTIKTDGTGSNFGVYLLRTNFTIVENSTVNTNGSTNSNDAIEIEQSRANRVLRNTLVTYGSTSNFGTYLLTNAVNNTLENNTIKTNGTGNANDGIRIDSANNTIKGNIIFTNGTSANVGVYVLDDGYGVTIINNTIKTNGTDGSNRGILFEDNNNGTVVRNDVSTDGTSANYGIELVGTNSTKIENNSIQTRGTTTNYGIHIDTQSPTSVFVTGIQIINNTVRTSGTSNAEGMFIEYTGNSSIINNLVLTNGTGDSNYGIHLQNSQYDLVKNNIVITDGAGKSDVGVRVSGSNGVGKHIFLNNNVTTLNGAYEFNFSISTPLENQLIYNNSLGEIRWINVSFLKNIDINVSNEKGLGLGRNLFIGNNTAALNISAFAQQEINTTANITFYGLIHDTNPFIFRLDTFNTSSSEILNGETLCPTGACSFISYNTSTGTLKFNTTGFSSFSSDQGCGTTISNKTLVQNVSSTGTCITIAADNVVLDCDGYTISYGSEGTGIGVDNTGYDNVTVKNCVIEKEGQSGSTNYGIQFSFAGEGHILNNTIQTGGTTQNFGVYLLLGTNATTIENNTIRTNGSAGSNFGIYLIAPNNVLKHNTILTSGSSSNVGVRLSSPSKNNTVENNTIRTNGTGGSNYGLLIDTANNTILGNIIFTNGTSSNNGIFCDDGAYSTIIKNNSIRTNGTSSTNRGIYSLDNNNGTIVGNKIHTSGTSLNYGIELEEVNSTLVENNTIFTYGTGASNYGIFSDEVISEYGRYLHAVDIINNTIFTRGTSSNYGIRINSLSSSSIIDNLIVTNGSSTSNIGIFISSGDGLFFQENEIKTQGTGKDHGINTNQFPDAPFKFINNNITTHGTGLVIDSGNSLPGVFIYNNSFGEINWTDNTFLGDMDINLTNDNGFGIGKNIYIESNIIALNTSAFAGGNINSSANLTLFNLTLEKVQRILRIDGFSNDRSTILGGTDCNGTSCNISNYNSSTGTLTFSTGWFSSFTADIKRAEGSFLKPTSLQEFMLNDTFEIEFNETLLLDQIVNVTFLINGTVYQGINYTENIWNYNFTIPDYLGDGNQTISARMVNVSDDIMNTQNITFVITPRLSSVSLSQSLIQGGNIINVIANNVNDSSNHTLNFYCSEDTNTPNASNTICTGGTVNDTGPLYSLNCSYTVASDDASHSVNCRVYDKITYSRSSNATFTTDSTVPSITINFPENKSFFNSVNVSLNYTVSDLNLASCTLLNGTGSNKTLSGCVNTTFIAINNKLNNITVYVNDSVGNVNFATVHFTVDTTLPLINFTAPTLDNASNISVNHFFVNVTVNETDEANITFYLFNLTHLINSTTFVDQTRTINFTNLTDNIYRYNVSVVDNASNNNVSETRTFTIDLTEPNVTSISFSPNSTDDVDPNVLLNFTINVTDKLLGVKTVILQYKQSGVSTFSNSTATYNSNTGLYYANFTPNIEDTWNYRIFTLDLVDNLNITSTQSISVDNDRTWIRTPATFDNIACGLSQTCKAGNLTINNTGDFTLNFDLSSNFGETSFNISEPFDLAAKKIKETEISLTAGSSADENSVIITIDATTNNAVPDDSSTNFTFTTTAGGPFFDLSIASAPTEVNRSAGKYFNLSVKLKNIGNETSWQTWVNWSLPVNWINVSGNLNQNYSNLTAGQIVYSNITVNLTSNSSTGIKVVRINVSTANNISDNTSASIVVTAVSTTETITETVTVTEGGGGGGGGSAGGGSAGGVTIIGEEKIESEAIFELVRGEDEGFMLPIKNTINGPLTNITVKVFGFLAQYIEIKDIPEIILANQTKNLRIEIKAPRYFTKGEWRLDFEIEGTVKKKTGPSTSRKVKFSERRAVTLEIHEISRKNATQFINLSLEEIRKLENLNLSTKKLEKLIQQAKERLDVRDYEGVEDIYNLIKDRVSKGIEVYDKIKDFSVRVKSVEERGIKTPDTIRLLTLARISLEREDYLSAAARLKEIDLTFSLETKGEFSLEYFIRNNPILIGTLGLSNALFMIIMILLLKLQGLNIKLKNLAHEKSIVMGLIKVAQKECFVKGIIDLQQYNISKLQYEKRINSIVQKTIEVESKKFSFFKPLKRKELERERLLDLIKQIQDKYILKEQEEASTYKAKIESYSKRLTEVESDIIVKETKKEIKTARRVKLFAFFGIKLKNKTQKEKEKSLKQIRIKARKNQLVVDKKSKKIYWIIIMVGIFSLITTITTLNYSKIKSLAVPLEIFKNIKLAGSLVWNVLVKYTMYVIGNISSKISLYVIVSVVTILVVIIIITVAKQKPRRKIFGRRKIKIKRKKWRRK